MIDVVLERLQWTIVSALESTPHVYTAVPCLTLPDFEEFFSSFIQTETFAPYSLAYRRIIL